MSRRSTVIKAGSQKPGETGARPFFVNDIMAEIDRAVAVRKAEADKAILAAEGEVAAIRRQAQEQGYNDGFKKGKEEGLQAGRDEALLLAKQDFAKRQAALVKSFQSTIQAINDERVSWRAAARKDLVDLAMAVARRVVKHVAEHEREVVIANISELAELTGARSDVTVSVNRDDAELARTFVNGHEELQQLWQHVRVVGDDKISSGGCHVDWRCGAVDASIETQLDRISAALGADPIEANETVTIETTETTEPESNETDNG